MWIMSISSAEQDDTVRYYKTGIWPDDGQRLLEQLRSDKNIQFKAEIPTQTDPLLSLILTWILPIFFFIAIGELLSRWMMKKMGNQMGGLGLSLIHIYKGVTFLLLG